MVQSQVWLLVRCFPDRDVKLICLLPSLVTGVFSAGWNDWRLYEAVVTTVQRWWGFSLFAWASQFFYYDTAFLIDLKSQQLSLRVDIVHRHRPTLPRCGGTRQPQETPYVQTQCNAQLMVRTVSLPWQPTVQVLVRQAVPPSKPYSGFCVTANG